MTDTVSEVLARFCAEIKLLDPQKDEYLHKRVGWVIESLEKGFVPSSAKELLLWLANRHENAGKMEEAGRCRNLAGQAQAHKRVADGLRFVGGARLG